MSIAVFRSDYVTNCAASTSVRFDRKEARNRQLHIFAERYRAFKKDEQMKRIIFVILILFPFLIVYSIKPDRRYRFYPEKFHPS